MFCIRHSQKLGSWGKIDDAAERFANLEVGYRKKFKIPQITRQNLAHRYTGQIVPRYFLVNILEAIE
jgi:hypothetical protein